jgi:hypothetical protein
MAWYRAGTVALTNNSTTVTGTNTSFAANARVGDAFIGPNGALHEVTNIASATVLSISPAYAGANSAAAAYMLAPIQGYVKQLADNAATIIQQWGAKLAALGDVSSENVVPVAKGGTGGITPTAARTGLGLKTAAVADIVGTVSQASGVPTGAIIERGSNANGSYIKYADGTLICWHLSPVYFTSTIAADFCNFTFPAAFSATPRLMDASVFDHPTNGAAGVARGWGEPFSATSLACKIAIYGHASTSAIWPGYVAIGRWF